MFTKLIKALLGAFGIIKKTKKFTTVNNKEFLQSLQPGSVVLTCSRGFLQDGIKGATDSYWCHSLLYIGKTAGTMIRNLYPELLGNEKIPMESQYNEIVEAQGGGVQVDNLQKNLGDNVQMVAFYRPISTVDLMKVLKRIYSNVGKNYGFLDFLSELFPDPAKVSLGDDNGFICSALTTDAWSPIETIVKKGIDPHKATPGDQYNYLEPNLKWQMTKYNW